MSEAYIGEIVMFAGNFAPRNWMLCNGQSLAIQQYAALFSILGTTYGGNGTTTFNLPNMQSRVPVHAGSGAGLSHYNLGQSAGAENVSLNATNLPAHSHPLSTTNSKIGFGVSSSNADSTNPSGKLLATSTSPTYVSGTPNNALASSVAFGPGAVTDPTGGNQPVSVIQPYLAVNFIICINGIYPSRN